MCPFAATLALLAVGVHAQAPLAEWSFDAGLGDWTSLDPRGSLSTTTDANVVGEPGGACLEYSYTPSAGTVAGALVPVTQPLTGAQGLRFHIKTSEYAWAAAALAEADGSAYLTTFSSLPGAWQEVALGLGEFRLMGDTQDENGRLDPGQVSAVVFGDAIYLLDAIAQQLPFIQPPELGPRMLWLDEVRIETEPVPPRWTEAQVAGVRAVRLESFESAPLQWLTLTGSGLDISYDEERKVDGELSLRLAYDVPSDKVFGVLTDLGDAPLAGLNRLRLSLQTEVPVTLLLELKELDESKYQARVDIAATGQFEELTKPLSEFALAGDSTDENGRLDVGQLKEFLLADLGAALGTPTGANTLWLDNLLFTE